MVHRTGTFKKCDTKPEIQGLVTNLFVWAGAKRLMSEENVARITSMLHRYYQVIFAQLAPGEEKHLKDEVKEPEGGDHEGEHGAEGEGEEHEETGPPPEGGGGSEASAAIQ